MSFEIDTDSFISMIKSNFSTVWESIQQNTKSIDECRQRMNKYDRIEKSKKAQEQRNKSKQPSLQISQSSALPDFEKELMIKSSQSHQELIKMTQSKQLDLLTDERPESKQFSERPPKEKNKKQRKNIKISDSETQKNQIISPEQQQNQERKRNCAFPSDKLETEIQMALTKISQISEQLSNLQLQVVKESKSSGKKFHDLQNQIEKYDEILSKNMNIFKKSEKEINELRNDISEYKLKKQARLMRMSGKKTANQNQENSDELSHYVVEKIQSLSKYASQLVTTHQYEDQIEHIHKKIEQMKRTLNDTVSQKELNTTINIMMKKMDKSNNIQENSSQMMIELKVLEHQKKIQNLTSLLNSSVENLTHNSRKKQQKISSLQQKDSELNSKIQNLQLLTKDHENFMRDMNNHYNKKLKENESQIIQTQENIEIINGEIKSIKNYQQSAEIRALSSSQTASKLEESLNKSDFDFQINNLKKKNNKLTLKVQSLKEDILIMREDFAREIENSKMWIEKKCDWESFRKGINYFEDKIKQVKTLVKALIDSMDTEKTDETNIAKRGWTCLCCDKDIKHFEGKLSEPKYANLFPFRYDSPKISSYMKQKQIELEHKRSFEKHEGSTFIEKKSEIFR